MGLTEADWEYEEVILMEYEASCLTQVDEKALPFAEIYFKGQ